MENLREEINSLITNTQKDGFELCMKILKDMSEELKKHNQTHECLFLQVVLTELKNYKKELYDDAIGEK